MSESSQAESAGKPGFTRRRFIIGSAGVSAVAALGGTAVRAPRAFAATAPSGPPTTTLPLPTTTEPEQLLLTWGNKPASEVTVSWSAPGTVAQPAPALRFSTQPITESNPGWLVKLPDPRPLDVTRAYGEATAISFTDGLNGQTTYFYHVQLKGLKAGTRYYYEVSDGAPAPVDGRRLVRDRAAGRAKFRFSSYGDLATPSWDLNASGNIWHESCDNSWYAVTAIESPGDGKGAPLFHLLNGDLCYANLDVDNAPGVWRDFGINVARSSANRPWMPALGNHECEFGTDDIHGHPGTAAGGIARPGRGGQLLERPLRLRPLPEPLPAAGQRRQELGRQPAAGQLLRVPGRHREVHLARRRRRDLPGRRGQLRDQHAEHGARGHHHRRPASPTGPRPTTASTPAASGTRRSHQLTGPGLRQPASPTCRPSGWSGRWPRPAGTTRST